jgi:hypothetical protein
VSCKPAYTPRRHESHALQPRPLSTSVQHAQQQNKKIPQKNCSLPSGMRYIYMLSTAEPKSKQIE